MRLRVVSILLTSLFLSEASSALPLTLGAEFELTSSKIISQGDNTITPESIEVLTAKKFTDRLREKCPECTFTTISLSSNWFKEGSPAR